ncbi:hypothetical protein [Planomonospora sp. ID82291]|uniref:hypothetical protein n=1 Tax=Planomonospora sp. ID82291 TaxID=2738136 RepID=UPI0018C3D385|nr:hypothetical protein [Planomonospora sp. ID82291]MBG0818324.1 hypothetical protein [Planomonospora sp. ID82291]
MPTFAARLNQLWEQVPREDGKPYTLQEVAEAVTAAGVPVTREYLSMLRNGKRVNPSNDLKKALAEFFGFEATFFADSPRGEQMRRELNELRALKDSGLLDVMRNGKVAAFARTAAGLPESDLATLQNVADAMRRAAELCSGSSLDPEGKPSA